MAKQKTAVPFRGTAAQEAKLREIIANYQNMQGALMPVLQQAQELYGYLPIEVQKIIAEGLRVPLEQVYGVTTFYAQFTLNPRGENQISICLGTACYVKGAGEVLARIREELGMQDSSITPDGKFSIDETRCLGCCALAPVMTINGKVYGNLKPDDIPGILAEYKH